MTTFSTLAITLAVGNIYRFKFITEFNRIGYDAEVLGSGLYRVVQIMNKDEIYEIGESVLIEMYKAAKNLSEENAKVAYTADKETFFNGRYFKLQAINNPFLYYYVPEAIIVEHPNVRVSNYAKLALMIDLGVTKDPALLASISETINEVLAPTYGITVSPTPMVHRYMYLTDEEYEAIQAERDATRQAVTNYKTECERLTAELAVANGKIASLEAIVVAAQ